jgi:hypothetical protein
VQICSSKQQNGDDELWGGGGGLVRRNGVCEAQLVWRVDKHWLLFSLVERVWW